MAARYIPNATKIRALRNSIGWSQTDLWTQAKISKKTVEKLENPNGRKNDENIFRKVANAFGVDWKSLIDRSDPNLAATRETPFDIDRGSMLPAYYQLAGKITRADSEKPPGPLRTEPSTELRNSIATTLNAMDQPVGFVGTNLQLMLHNDSLRKFLATDKLNGMALKASFPQVVSDLTPHFVDGRGLSMSSRVVALSF